jgi:hypothetical protein
MEFVEKLADKKRVDVTKIVNDLIRGDRQLANVLG